MRALSRNRIISAMVALVVFIAALCTYSSNVGASNTKRGYRIFNAQTNEYKCSYSLSALSSTDISRSVIGPDGREIDWSKSGVCKIITSTGSWGTGFVVDEHTIATAAHCTYDKIIAEILLFDSNGNLELSATPVEYHVPIYYINQPNDDDKYRYDYSLLTVEEDLSDYVCFNLGTTLDSFGTSNASLKVTGFSGDLNNTLSVHTNYTGIGNILSLDDMQLFYNADTYGGNSGGPVYITETRLGNIYNTVLAIHTHKEHGDSAGNRGTRITTDLLHFYYNNSNISCE